MPDTPAVAINTPEQSDSIDRAVHDSLDHLLAAHRREVRILSNSGRTWLQIVRSMDVTGDGRRDDMVIRAEGTRGDSLQIRLMAVIDRDTMVLAKWESGYELMDPPYAPGAPKAVIDSFMRSRLIDVLAGIDVTTERITKAAIEEGGGECEDDQELATCLRTRWGLDSINGKDAAAEALARPVPVVDFGYGYETSVTIAWIPALHRFVGIASCC